VWLPLVIALVQVVGTWLAGRDQHDRREYDAVAAALLGGTALALVGRQRAPIGTLVLVTAGTATYYGLGYPYGPAFIALLLATVGAVRRGRQRMAWATLGVGYLGFLVAAYALGARGLSAAMVLTHLVWLAAIAGIAELVRVRAEHFREVRERMREARRREASEERLLLARELHDALAHNVSLISVQASTALHLFDDDPERARSALAAIKAASHETLDELRATVGALRAQADTAPRAPAGGLHRLDALLAQTRAVGLAVTLKETGSVRKLPTRVDLAAYRIVQEALTNVRRHSGASAVEVVLEYEADALDVRIADDGEGAPEEGSERYPNGQPGHGLRGMRERAIALGGTLQAGRATGGGFMVSARLPLSTSSAVDQGQQG
jgi:signal transduction histidine kinase